MLKSYLPEWQDSFRSILNNAWELRYWGISESNAFVANFFPSFLSIYRRYQLPVQRVDAIRYLILKQFGGVYVDMDYELLANPEFMFGASNLVLSLRELTEND
jgi:mannosyltransferase OCH1-like enzyme